MPRAEVVVIGSGFGGSMVAWQLAQAGVRPLIIERGRWIDRDASAWDPQAILVARKYAGRTPFEVRNGRRTRELFYPDEAVGGRSVFYGAASFRMRREDFASAESEGELVHWPFAYHDLAPYYDQAETLIGVAGAPGGDPTEPPRAQPYGGQPPPYGPPARHVAQAARSLGLRPFPIPLAINFQAVDGRPACVRCSTCDLFPCRIGAKNDLAVTVLSALLARGVEIRARTAARRLLRQGDRIVGVECLNLDTGRTEQVACETCVVSCGAIGSPALLLYSGLGQVEPNGDLVGRYLTRHCNAIAAAVFPFETNPTRTFHKQVGITDFYFGGPAGEGPPGPWGMIQGLQGMPADALKALGSFPWNRVGALTARYHIYLMCMAHETPDPANRVTLADEARDAFGLPLARVTHKYSARDLAARRALVRQAGRILREAGGVVRVRLPVNTFSHAVGTCRFGDDPRQAVLDPWCRFFGLKNLYVVDGSFMPSAGAVNPSLTIAANALRVGEHLAREGGR